MKVELKSHDDDGNVVIQGTLNSKEIAFVMQIGINTLLSHGAMFMLAEASENEEGEEQIRIDVPEGTTFQ